MVFTEHENGPVNGRERKNTVAQSLIGWDHGDKAGKEKLYMIQSFLHDRALSLSV